MAGAAPPLNITWKLGRLFTEVPCGTGSVRGAQAEGRAAHPTVVRLVLQAADPAAQVEIGPLRRIATGHGDCLRYSGNRGEAADIGPPQVGEGPAHQEGPS